MDRVVPWRDLVALIEPFAPERGRCSQQPFAVETPLRVHFMQQWFNLSDRAMEEAPHDMPVSRDFAGLSNWGDAVPSDWSNVNDVVEGNSLLHGQEEFAFGDAGYQGVDKRAGAKAHVRWHVAMCPGLPSA